MNNRQLFAHALACVGYFLIAGMNAPSASAAGVANTSPALSMNGYLSARYTLRSVTTASSDKLRDEDLSTELRIDATTPRSGRYEFHFLGAARSDLDGNSDLHTYYPLEDIGNAQYKDTLALLYEAHLDINNPLPLLTQLRLGRQYSTRDVPVLFDGMALDGRPASFLGISLYGGRGVNLFEVAGSKKGTDSISGAGIDLLPTSTTGFSIDYLAIIDERDYFDQLDTHDRLLSFKLSQRITRNMRALARYRVRNGEGRDGNLRFLATFPEAGVDVGASYTRQFRTQKEQSTAVSPFYDLLGPSVPYQSMDLKVRTAVGKRTFLDLGYFRREVLDQAQAGAGVRDYTRSFAGIEVSDLFTKGLACSVIGELWDAERRTFSTAGFDATYAFGRSPARGKVSAGTYYSLYKYDSLFVTDEHDRVRTYYGKLHIPVLSGTFLDLAYEWEEGVDTFQTMKAGVRYDF